MTYSIARLPRTPSSSSNPHKSFPLLIHLLIDAATILSQSSAAESTSAAYRQTKYTVFQNVYATQLPLAIASEATKLKCAQLCIEIPFCSGFNYLRSPSKSGGPCDSKADPKGSTCEFLAFENISNVHFAQEAMPLCRILYANWATTNAGSSGLSPCLSSPCQNLGVCVESTNDYFCNCTEATAGRNCETTSQTSRPTYDTPTPPTSASTTPPQPTTTTAMTATRTTATTPSPTTTTKSTTSTATTATKMKTTIPPQPPTAVATTTTTTAKKTTATTPLPTTKVTETTTPPQPSTAVAAATTTTTTTTTAKKTTATTPLPTTKVTATTTPPQPSIAVAVATTTTTTTTAKKTTATTPPSSSPSTTTTNTATKTTKKKTTATTGTQATIVGYNCTTNNPCVPGSGQYYPAESPSQYIQCGAGNTCYTRDCNSPLRWDQSIQNCNW